MAQGAVVMRQTKLPPIQLRSDPASLVSKCLEQVKFAFYQGSLRETARPRHHTEHSIIAADGKDDSE
jgi:hypothetical protein